SQPKNSTVGKSKLELTVRLVDLGPSDIEDLFDTRYRLADAHANVLHMATSDISCAYGGTIVARRNCLLLAPPPMTVTNVSSAFVLTTSSFFLKNKYPVPPPCRSSFQLPSLTSSAFATMSSILALTVALSAGLAGSRPKSEACLPTFLPNCPLSICK